MNTPHAGRKELYFLRITPLNWVLALWYSLRGPVFYWRSALRPRLLSRFSRVAVEQEITRDQWLQINDAAFDVWRDEIYPALSAAYPVVLQYRGTRIDFSLTLIQHLSQEFERVYQFARSLEASRGTGARIVEPWFARVLPRQMLDDIAGRCTIIPSRLNRLLETPYEWAYAVGHLLRLALVALRRLVAPSLAVETGITLWTGISPQEMPAQDERLDFAWPTRYAGIACSRLVYFVPVEPTNAQKRYFARDGRIVLGPTGIGRLITVGAALHAFAAAAIAAVRAALCDAPAVAPYAALFAARAFVWVAIAEKLRPAGYVTTTSYCWPERPEVAALAAKGVATTIWSYSANALVFAHETPFRDLAVWRTAFLAREFWVWNRAYRDWMIRRQIGADAHRPRFRVAGPLMCGDAGWLARDRKIAKARLGLDLGSFYLAIFDVPLTGTGHRRTFYGGPRLYVDGYHEHFYRALIELLGRHPALRVFIKLKRPTTSQWHRFPKSQLELLDERNELARSGRVVIIHEDTDPYLPVAACDAAIGMPYTSPVLAAAALGRPAAYFDPLALARHPSEPAYRHMTLTTTDSLDDCVGQWLAGRNTLDPREIDCLLPLAEPGFDLAAAITGERLDGRHEAAPAPRARQAIGV